MSHNLINMIGREYGKLRVKARDMQTNSRSGARWICYCGHCGQTKSISGTSLRGVVGRISCGCKPSVKQHGGFFDQGQRRKRNTSGGPRLYEPGSCPSVKTCGVCQRAGRERCCYSATAIESFKMEPAAS